MVRAKLTRMTAKEIEVQLAARAPRSAAVAQARYDATTEQDIRDQMVEEGYDPDEAVPVDAQFSVPVKLVREKLRMTQPELARLLRVPLGTLRNWEQNRFGLALTRRCRHCSLCCTASLRLRYVLCVPQRNVLSAPLPFPANDRSDARQGLLGWASW